MANNNGTQFFGCWGESGHYLWSKNKESDPNRAVYRGGLTAHLFDCSPLLLSFPEKVSDGCRTYFPHLVKTIISWWGSPFDGRPGTNNSVVVDGERTPGGCWRIFQLDFPELSSLWEFTEVDENMFKAVIKKG